MRDRFISLMVVDVFTLFGIMGSNEEELHADHAEQGEVAGQETEIVYIPYDVAGLVDDLDKNALEAADKYDEQYVELTSKLNMIDSAAGNTREVKRYSLTASAMLEL